MNQLVPASHVQPSNVEVFRQSTDAATLCKDIVVSTAKKIGDRNYVPVEGWQSIALAHGCVGSSRDVENVPGGVRAIGQVRRMSDGQVIAEAEGFVGQDETTWYGGMARKWRWGEKRGEKVWYEEEMPKRADYAIRAMAQTRAISRACRAAFAHVVVMMNAGLSTTPAEEVPDGGFNDHQPQSEPRNVTPQSDKQPGPAGGDKRLSSAEAKRQSLDKQIHDAILGCTTRDELAEWERTDTMRAQVPKGWLDSIQNELTLRGEEIDKEQGDGEVQPSAARAAALTAMALCKSEDELAAWGKTNAAAIMKMGDADRVALRAAYSDMMDGFRQSQPSEPKQDRAAFGADAPKSFRETSLALFASYTVEAELRAWSDANTADLQAASDEDYQVIHTAWTARAEAIRTQKAAA